MAYGGRQFFANNKKGKKGKKRQPTYNGPSRNQSFGDMPNDMFNFNFENERRISLPSVERNFFPNFQNRQGAPSNYVDLTTDGGSANNSLKRKRDDTWDQGYDNLSRSKHGRFDEKVKQYAPMTDEIEDYARRNAQSFDMLEKKQELRSVLLQAIWKEYPSASLHLVGSTWNGFATETSDVDLCAIVVRGGRDVNQRHEAKKYLRNIERQIRQIKPLKDVQLIPARIPILKFTDTISGCECDLNINNEFGVRNTHLMRAYAQHEQRIRPLVLAIKHWAKLRKINDARLGTFSSYALVLLVLHYLQVGCLPPVVEPFMKIYPDLFPHDSDVDTLPGFEPALDVIAQNRSQNFQSVGELFRGFFRYYDEVFDWGRDVASVRVGRTLLKDDFPDFRDKNICVEEPFEGYNTARSVYDIANFNTIKREFNRANARLYKNVSFEYIL